jgi:pilus assembly protein Flp/PilA
MLTSVYAMLLSLKSDRRGVTALEYGVLAALIIGVVAATISTIGTSLETALSNIAGAFP